MKQKTSITLSADLITRIDRQGGDRNRSEFIEAALRDYFRRRDRLATDSRDLAIINRSAARLNKEAGDVLSYQTEL